MFVSKSAHYSHTHPFVGLFLHVYGTADNTRRAQKDADQERSRAAVRLNIGALRHPTILHPLLLLTTPTMPGTVLAPRLRPR